MRILFSVVRYYGNKYFQSDQCGRIDQRCEKGRSNEVIKECNGKQFNDFEITKKIVRITRSRKVKEEKETRQRANKKRL